MGGSGGGFWRESVFLFFIFSFSFLCSSVHLDGGGASFWCQRSVWGVAAGPGVGWGEVLYDGAGGVQLMTK